MGVVAHIVQCGQLCFAVANTEAHKGLLLKSLQVTDFREVSLGSHLLAQYSVTTAWNSSGGAILWQECPLEVKTGHGKECGYCLNAKTAFLL